MGQPSNTTTWGDWGQKANCRERRHWVGSDKHVSLTCRNQEHQGADTEGHLVCKCQPLWQTENSLMHLLKKTLCGITLTSLRHYGACFHLPAGCFGFLNHSLFPPSCFSPSLSHTLPFLFLLCTPINNPIYTPFTLERGILITTSGKTRRLLKSWQAVASLAHATTETFKFPYF